MERFTALGDNFWSEQCYIDLDTESDHRQNKRDLHAVYVNMHILL